MLPAGDLRAILRRRGFRRLLLVRLTTQTADAFFQAGLAGSLLFSPDRQPTGVAIALGFAVLLVPYSVLGPYVGVLLDRWSRRSILITANLLRAALVVPTAALIWVGYELGFALLALLVIAVNRFVLAGLSASLPHVVDDSRLVTGNALATTFGTMCFSVGLGAAGVVRYQLGAGDLSDAGIASCAVVGYLAAAAVAGTSFSPTDLGPDTPPAHRGVLREVVDVARGMVSGARHLAGRPRAAHPLIAQSAHRFLYGVLAIGTLLLYRNYFPDGDDFSASIAGLGQVVVAGAVGALLGAAITPAATRRIGGRTWITGLLTAVGVAVMVFGLPYQPVLLVLAVFLINLASQGTKIVVDTALQHECADDHRGWVFTVNDTAFNLCFVVGLFVGALLLPADGHGPAVLVAVSAGYAVLAAWFWRASSRWPGAVTPGLTVASRSAH